MPDPLFALRDDLFQPRKSPAADEQDVRRIHLQEFLLRMLAPALRRHRCHGAFHDLQQRLLHAFARNVAGDRRIVRLAGDLVDLVDIDDPALRPFHVVFTGLQQFQDDVLHILADVARFRQRRRIRHCERHIQNTRQRLRQQRLAAAGRPDQQDIRLRQLDIRLRRIVQPFVVVMHRHRQHALGMDLADHIIIQHLADLARCRHPFAGFQPGRLRLFPDDIHAQLDAFVADEHGRPCNQLAHLMLALATERAVKRILAVAAGVVRHSVVLCHTRPCGRSQRGSLGQGPRPHNAKKPPPKVASAGAALSL